MTKNNEIQVQIINPEALEKAGINKTKVLIDIFWQRLISDLSEQEIIINKIQRK